MKKERRFYLEAALLLGKNLIENDEPEEARNILEKLVGEFPENVLVHFCLGEALFLKKDFARSIEEMEKSLLLPVEVGLFPINKTKIKYYQLYLLGQSLVEIGKFDRAEETFRKSLNLHRDHYKSLQALGLLALQKGRFQEAIEFYEKAIAEGGLSDCNFANLGLAYRKMGRQADAEKALVRSLEVNPERREARVNLGHLYREKKDFVKAAECYEKALDGNKNSLEIRLMLSDVYFHLQELEKLVAECDTILADLALPRNIILNSFEELGSLYDSIGDTLKKKGKQECSMLAYQVSFLVAPSPERLEKAISAATSCGLLKTCLEEITAALQAYGDQFSSLGPLGISKDSLASPVLPS